MQSTQSTHAGRNAFPISHLSISETLPSVSILNSHTVGAVWVQTDLIQTNAQLGHSHKHTHPGSWAWDGVYFWSRGGLLSHYMPHITASMTESPVYCYYGRQGLLMLMQLDLKHTCAIADVLFVAM